MTGNKKRITLRNVQEQPTSADDSQSPRPPAGSTPEEVFAARVRQRREHLGWSQTGLAKVLEEMQGLDLDGTAITRLERGERRVRLNEAVAFATVLGLDLYELVAPHPGDLADQIESTTIAKRNAEYAAQYWAHEAAVARKRLAELQLQHVIEVEGAEVLKHLRGGRTEEGIVGVNREEG